MSRRKAIAKSVRFEVFKRDSFTCQYCGSKSPDVVLNVDHIKPVAKGGDDEITNLITSCFSCNSGKSDKPLSDKTMVVKQQAQLEALNERRQQHEMMVKWREGLADIQGGFVQEVCAIIRDVGDFEPNDSGKKNIRNWLKKFTASELADAAKRSFNTYARYDDNGTIDSESWERAFKKIPAVAANVKNGSMSDELLAGYYVAAVFANKWLIDAWDKPSFAKIIEAMIVCGADKDFLRDLARGCELLGQFWPRAIGAVRDFPRFRRLISGLNEKYAAFLQEDAA